MQTSELTARILGYFRQIAAIPRGSGNEGAITDWLEAFAREQGLEALRDENRNLVIRKPGQHGGEGAAPLILQGHSDMVCAKAEGSAHRFDKDPIRLVEKDGWLSADGTTLGADNGLGMAYICMLLADKALRHPPLEALITSGEEVGMTGMNAFDAGVLRGRRMINLDAEENGVLITSCAGGQRSVLTLPAPRTAPDSGSVAFRVGLSGLAGGHSGVDIHKGLGNAALLLGRVAAALMAEAEAQLCAVEAGSGANVIPASGQLTFYARPEYQTRLTACLEALSRDFRGELPSADGGLSLTLSPVEAADDPLTADSAAAVVRCLALLPYGAMRYLESLPGQVSLSSNPGVVATEAGHVAIQSLTRGNVNSGRDWVVAQLRALAALCGGSLETGSGYCAWEYAPESSLRQQALAAYRRHTGADMTASAIHGGLECALMAGKLPGLDMISLGPTLYDVHTPGERFELAAAQDFWAFLTDFIQTDLA